MSWRLSAQKAAEKLLNKHKSDVKVEKLERQSPATEAQKGTLRRMGVQFPEGISKATASELIDLFIQAFAYLGARRRTR